MEPLSLSNWHEPSRLAIKALGYFSILFLITFLIVIPLQFLLFLILPKDLVTTILGYVVIVVMFFNLYLGVMKTLFDEGIIKKPLAIAFEQQQKAKK